MKMLRNQLSTITVVLFVVIILILNISFGALSFQYSEELHQQYNDKVLSLLDKKLQTADTHAEAILSLMKTNEYALYFSNNMLLQNGEKQVQVANTVKRDLDLLNGPSSYISSIYMVGKDSNQFGYAYYTADEKMDSFISQLDTIDLLNSGLISVIYRDKTVFAEKAEIENVTRKYFLKNQGTAKYDALLRLRTELSDRLISCMYIDSRIIIIVFDEEKLFGLDYAENADLKLRILSGDGKTVYSNIDNESGFDRHYAEITVQNYTVLFQNEKFSMKYYYYLIPLGSFIVLLPLFIILVGRVSRWIVTPINQITEALTATEKTKISLKNIGRFSLKNRIFLPLFSLLLAHYLLFCGIDSLCLSVINRTQNQQIIEINKKIIEENVVSDFYDPSKIVPVSLDEIEKKTANIDINNAPELYDILKVGATNGYELDLVLILDENGSVLYRSKAFHTIDETAMVRFALEKAKDKTASRLLLYSKDSAPQTAFWLKPIADANGQTGYMITVIAREAYSSLVQELKWVDVLIVDNAGKVVYNSLPDADSFINSSDGDVLSFGNEKYVVYRTQYGDFGWEMMYMQPSYVANRMLERFVNYILAVVFTLLVIAYIAVTLFAHRLSQNVNRLIDCMLTTEKFTDNLNRAGNEIYCLADSYNNMLDRIGFLTEELVREEKRQENLRYLKAQSELIALKAQVNAHFIFNVLNIIHEDAVRRDNEIITGIVEALSSMIRYSMAPEMLTTVREEFESVNRYIYIQKIRYGSHFEFYYETESEIEDVKMLRLVIQPLVENAIDHGLFNMNGGKVYLSIYQHSGILHICVTDDGIGMRKNQVEKLMEYIHASEEEAGRLNRNHRFGVALRNIYQRMKTYYGEGADMRFISEFMNGTTVELTVPINEGEQTE